jgi:1-acyl-sn-glycerol-3-phosphate acyltransferase
LGIGMLVARSVAPVIPARVFGAYEAFPRGKVFPRPTKVTVVFGEPLLFTELRQEAMTCSKPRMKEIYREVATSVEGKLAELRLE